MLFIVILNKFVLNVFIFYFPTKMERYVHTPVVSLSLSDCVSSLGFSFWVPYDWTHLMFDFPCCELRGGGPCPVCSLPHHLDSAWHVIKQLWNEVAACLCVDGGDSAFCDEPYWCELNIELNIAHCAFLFFYITSLFCVSFNFKMKRLVLEAFLYYHIQRLVCAFFGGWGAPEGEYKHRCDYN